MIFFETAGQSRAFLLLLYAGFGAGLLYDLCRFLAKPAPRWARAALDALWCLATGLCCALALAIGGENRLRAYALLGLCAGAGIYCLGLRRVFMFLRGMRKPSSASKPPKDQPL